MNRFMLAGTGSGCGKTTVTCAVLSAFSLRGLDAVSFKCGPDYIDPMFHREIAGIHARNLDPYFCDGNALREQFAKGMGRDASVIEAAMGYYDGIAATCEASAYTVARETKTPVVLVVNCMSVGNSVGAVLEGFARHRGDSGIKGVIFNNLSAARYKDMARVAANSGVKPYGFLPRDTEISIKSRHLGLVTAGEIGNIRGKLSRLGETALKTLDIDGLIDLSSTAPRLGVSEKPPEAKKRVRLAVASDEAFCFRYAENLELLEEFGAELIYFSPLHDARLPENIGGLYLCGGYPELYAKELSTNTSMIEAIREAVNGGMPAIAECGGFMALHDTLDGFPMAGAITGRAFQTERLRRFGYAELTARYDNLICAAGEKIRVHEFHYWDSDNTGDGFTAKKAGRDIEYACVHATSTLYAGFPHLYFPSKPEIARRFVAKSEEFV